MKETILFLPGDGIGPEVIVQTRRVLERLITDYGWDFIIKDGLIGGSSIDAHGKPLTMDVLELARSSNAILMGAIGGPKWDGIDRSLRPERGLLALRKELGLYANLRPILCFPALADASTLKRPVVSGLDILFVRELIGGIYFGEPRGIKTLADGRRQGVNTQSYASDEIERIAHTAFRLARKRRNHVTSVDKSNVLESHIVWRETVTELHRSTYPDVVLDHILVDNCAMQLVRDPKSFDVLLCDNIFGDILSDEASQLTGSIGMLPSASLGAVGEGSASPLGLYEPVHGSAPDIAGQDIANPCAAILSLAMLLRTSLDRAEAADRIEQAVGRVLEKGLRTKDIWVEDATLIGTREMGEAVISALD